MNALGPLQIVERDRVVYLRVADTSASTSSFQLANGILDVCIDVRQRLDAPVALALISDSRAFYIQTPKSADDCDEAKSVWRESIEALADVPVPTIACLAGDAVGTAWELALACDLRLAERHVMLGSSEITFGRMPACGGIQRLARLLGSTRALEMLLMGELVGGATALERGLVNDVSEPGALDALLESSLEPLRSAAPIALTYVKEAVLRGMDLPLADGLRLEADLATLLQTTHDRAEGLSAFLERRTPRFEGC